MKKKTLLILSIVLSVLMTASLIYVANGFHQSSKLLKAVENDDYESAKAAIDKGAWVNKRRTIWYIPELALINDTPLIVACEHANEEMVQLLLDNGADVNVEDNFRDVSPLMEAVSGNDENRFRLGMYIINQGGDIFAENKYSSVFSRALYISETDSEQNINECYELLKYLLASDVEPTMPWGPESALTYAARYRNYSAVDLLISEGYYEVDSRDNNGDTALIVAAKYGQVKAVKVLLKHGASLALQDKDGKTALDYAIEIGNEEIIDLLSQK